ncbi:MAG: hypothetical protein ACKO96_13660, partial [Flammeovirgaceae bacterium]
RDLYLYEFYSKNREKTILDQKILQLNPEETLFQAGIVQNNIVISTNKRVLHFNLDKDFNCETIFIREKLEEYGAHDIEQGFRTAGGFLGNGANA